MSYMTPCLDALKKSNVWCERYDLPLSGYYGGSEGPQNNNPWFYLNLSVKVIKANQERIPMVMWQRIFEHAKNCEVYPGLYNRWPKQAPDDVTSHDELIGIAALSGDLAQNILKYLEAHDGVYINSKVARDKEGPIADVKWNLSRFFWFMSFLKSCAGVEISLYSQAAWSAHVLFDVFTAKPTDASGRLLIWTMLPEMERWPLCGWVCALWRWRMNKLGITPKTVLALEPKENPVLSEWAPSSF